MSDVIKNMVEKEVSDEKEYAALRLLGRGKLSHQEIAEDLHMSLDIVNGLAEKLESV